MPQSMYRPRVIRPNRRIRIPELCLQEMTTRIIEATCILAMKIGRTAQLLFGT